MALQLYNYNNPQKNTPTSGGGFVNIKPYQYSPLPPLTPPQAKQPLLGAGGKIKTTIDKAVKGGLNSLYDIAGGLILPGSKPEDLRNPQFLKDTAEAIVPETLRTIGNVVSHPIKSAQSAVGGATRGISDAVTGIITNLFVPKSEQAATSVEVKNILDKYLGSTPDNNISQGFHVGGEAAPAILAGGALGELGAGFGSKLLGRIGAPTGTLGDISANLAKAKLGGLLGGLAGGATGFVGIGQASIPTDSTLKDRAEQATKDLVALGLFHVGSKAFDFAKARIFDGLKTQSTSNTPPPGGGDDGGGSGGIKLPVKSVSKPNQIPISNPETPAFMIKAPTETFSDAFPKPVNIKPFDYSNVDKSTESSGASKTAPIQEVSPETTDVSQGNSSKVKTSKPVDISPTTKSSKIGKSVEAKAVENKLTKGFGKTAQYETINLKDQAKRATDLVNDNHEQARSIIRGDEPLPEGLKGTALITAMEEHIKQNPNADTAYELANSPLISGTSEAAQEMRLAAERSPDSATSRLQDIRRAREAKIDNLPKKRSGAIKDLKESTNRVNLPIDDLKWDRFLDTIKC